jgi:hypothetical protein
VTDANVLAQRSKGYLLLTGTPPLDVETSAFLGRQLQQAAANIKTERFAAQRLYLYQHHFETP